MPRSVMRLLPHLLWLAGVVGLAVALGLILSGTQGQQTAQAPEPTAVPLTTAQPAGTLPPGPFDSPIETPTPEATETVEPPPTSTVEPTPESTLVPTPTLILPTLTPMPRALGEILYLQYDANQKLLYRVPVDATGDAIAAPIPIEVSTGLANATYSAIGAIYPSPNRKIAAIISGVEAGHQVALYDFTTGQILPLLREHSATLGYVGKFLGWSADSQFVLYRADVGQPGVWLVDVAQGSYRFLWFLSNLVA